MNEISPSLMSEITVEAQPVLTWSEERLGVGVPVMDGYHQEFLGILSALMNVPDSVFPTLFSELVRHTRAHFTQEEQLMKETDFPAAQEHIDEHRRVLRDLEALLTRINRGRLMMPREFVKNGMPEWFGLHLSTMDSALAAHVKAKLDLDQS